MKRAKEPRKTTVSTGCSEATGRRDEATTVIGICLASVHRGKGSKDTKSFVRALMSLPEDNDENRVAFSNERAILQLESKDPLP
ncbi:hypothetical protein PR002_g23684 [Phytophthora rubi]|nr:hypothetical protein PR002_g23684 [Phytophthora rubi]